jgi:tetratricopeptide repeat protein/DUF2914 family protein
MAEVRDPASSEIAAAELAAGSGDFPSAEQHLSRAVELEEMSFGPMHAELASVLNNLGVVYERLDRPDKAEACYRRAYTIARASLPAGDPGIELSATNLREFCAARDIPFEPPIAKVVAPPPPPLDLPHTRAPDLIEPLSHVETPEPAASLSPRTLAIGALVVVAVILGAIVATRSSSRTSETVPAPSSSAVVPRSEPAPTPGPATPAAAPALQAPTSARAPQAAASPKPAPPAPPPAARRDKPARPSVVPTLVSAQLCQSLQTAGQWHCTPVDGAVAGDPVYFYTRMKSVADTTVEHRWYRDTRLEQKMSLRIRANEGTGYRTYTRRTVGTPGDWKVELRAVDGTLLHEERFTVGR